MDRMDRVNELIRSLLAATVNQQVQLMGAMITIVEVETSPDLKSAKVLISVLPDKFYGQALAALRLVWRIDNRPRRADSLEELFDQISQEPR